MRRFFIMTGIVILGFILQTTVLHWIALANIVPNFLVIITVTFGYFRGKKEGMYIGFFLGLLVDLCYGNLIGLYAFLYMAIGYLAGKCNQLYYGEDLMVSVLFVAIGDFGFNLLCYCFDFLLRGRISFFYYLIHIIIPEMVYTVLLSVFVCKLLHKLNSFLGYNGAEEV